MSQKHVEIVVAQFENTNARDFAAVMDAWADDIVLALHGDLRGIGPGPSDGPVGKQAVGEWFGDLFRTVDSGFEIEESCDLGDQVLIIATHQARGRASGAPVTVRPAYVYTVRDDKIVRCDVYSAKAEALEAVGLAE